MEPEFANEMDEPILESESFLMPFFRLFNRLKGDEFVLVPCCEGCVLRDASRDRKVVSAGVGGSIDGNDNSFELKSSTVPSTAKPLGTTNDGMSWVVSEVMELAGWRADSEGDRSEGGMGVPRPNRGSDFSGSSSSGRRGGSKASDPAVVSSSGLDRRRAGGSDSSSTIPRPFILYPRL